MGSKTAITVPGVVHGVVDHFAGQGSGLACAETGAKAQDQGVAVFDEVFLGREQARR